LRVEPAEGSFTACAGSGGSQERYQIIGQLMTADLHAQTGRFVAAVSAVEHDLAQAGWGAFRRSEADPQYLAASRREITVSFFDVADSFDAVPPPVSERFIVAGPCTAVAAVLVPQLQTVRDYYGPTLGPLPPFKM
jgi:hypothetical protein